MGNERSDKQLHLFGAPEPAKPRAPVGPAPVPDDVREVADGLPREIYLGTSSWSFPGWQGRVYDRQASTSELAREGLAAYARHPLLRAVGIDRTYYAPLPAEAFAGYAAVVPDAFRFLVKAPALCTSPQHRDDRGRPGERNAMFLDPVFAVDAFVGPATEGLKTRTGPLVFQFSPLGAEVTGEPERFAARLGRFLEALPEGPHYAVELRDAALLCPDYFEALRQNGATHCLNVHPRMPPVAEQSAQATPGDGPLVARWMLHSSLHYEAARERYAPFSRIVDEDLVSRASLARLCARSSARGKQAVVIANNKAEGSAPETLYRLAGAVLEALRAAD